MTRHVFPAQDIDSIFICLDCKESTLRGGPKSGHYYTVSNQLWNSVTAPSERRGMLCLDCLAKRLPRPLAQSDFPAHLPINQTEYMVNFIKDLSP